MADGRVQSKNLFNFVPTGMIDQDIIDKEKEMMEQAGMDQTEEEMREQMDQMSDEDFAAFTQEMMAGMCDYAFKHPTYEDAANACDHTSISVSTNHDGNYDVEVLVHAPKIMEAKTSKPCIIYAHGGGVIAGSALQYKNLLSYMATSCEVVVFNVDYRLAPGTRSPNNVLDFYEVVKYVSGHAA